MIPFSSRFCRVPFLPAATLLLVSMGSVAVRTSAAETDVFPAEDWATESPENLGMKTSKLHRARDYALTGGGAGMITRHGQIAISWGDPQRKYDLKSTSKSIGVTSLGLAIDDGRIDLNDRAVDHHGNFGVPPSSNQSTGWLDQVTIRQLANQSAGFEKPGGYHKLLFEPGTTWHYSDGGPNWLAECVTLAMDQDIETLMFGRILNPIGVTEKDLHWRPHQYREKQIGNLKRCEFGSGVHANVDAMARIGLLYLREGAWKGRRLLSESFIRTATAADPTLHGLPEHGHQHGNASQHYGLLWWNNADGALSGVPKDACWSWGLHDSLIVVIPSLDVVVSRAGESWKRSEGANHYDVLAPFLGPIVQSIRSAPAAKPGDGDDTKVEGQESRSAIDRNAKRGESGPPYPYGKLEIRWAPRTSIGRLAPGSDNWPITWMDDGAMLTAYGDGWGFTPKVEQKLSMGIARIEGGPQDFRGINVRSESGETIGQGPNGVKASGMLMVSGTVYLLARNTDNSQLAWSTDRGLTWQWSEWKFKQSFGCPSFVNFGQDYTGARDDSVYLVSPDSDSAYEPADQMVMARVGREQLRDRDAYQFFAGLNDRDEPQWSSDIADRRAVFRHPQRCYRGAMTFNPGLQQYLWCQVLPESDHRNGPRFEGGFGVYAAAEPWGPWTTIFFTNHWDVGPGETSSIPAKWIADDGRTIHLVFSGDDAFSVRRGVVNDRH